MTERHFRISILNQTYMIPVQKKVLQNNSEKISIVESNK